MTDETSTQTALLDRVVPMVREHPGLAVSLAYAAATVIGMVSSYTLLSRFGINVFDYAEAGDFLVLAIRSPMASLSVILGGAVALVALPLDRWMRRRVRLYDKLYSLKWWERVSYHPIALVIYFALYAWLGSLFYATEAERRLRSGATPPVTVALQSQEAPVSAVLLHTTRSYVFLLEPSGDVRVVPVENVAWIEAAKPEEDG